MTPTYCTWDGESFTPLKRHQQLADKQFTVGEIYPMVPHEERSIASHRQYFASLYEAWMNLPEGPAAEFPSVEHLRKYALIKAGFRDGRSIACKSKAEARRVAAFVEPMDEFAVVVVLDKIVTVYTAKSQSMRAMGKAVFQRSKDAVLDIAWELCGVDKREAAKHVGSAA